MNRLKWLVLVPTEFERRLIVDLSEIENHADLRVELCGFGPIASAARCSQLLHQTNPAAVVLLGIAGAYGSATEVGIARLFKRVDCLGVGVGSGTDFVPGSELGWHQIHLESPAKPPLLIGDSLPLAPLGRGNAPAIYEDVCDCLLTVCSASANLDDAAIRKSQVPDAVAEDMEAFGVALACKLHETPCHVIRGISNKAGVRDKSEWKTVEAMTSASKLLRQLIESDS